MPSSNKENREERASRRLAASTQSGKKTTPKQAKSSGNTPSKSAAKDKSGSNKAPAKIKSAPEKRKDVQASEDEPDDPDSQLMTPARAQELLEELRATKAKLAEERDARLAAEESANQAQEISKKRRRNVKVIPRPTGTCGRTYQLRDEMRLGDRKDKSPEENLARKRKYSKILQTVRDVALLGGLKWQKGIRDQDTVALGAVFEVARKEAPYLKRFENDWATAQIITQFFMNRRRHSVKKGKVIKAGNRSNRKGPRKRILGEVAPAAARNPGTDNEGEGNIEPEGAEEPDAGSSGPGIGGEESDSHSSSSESEKDYGDEEEEEDDDDEEDEEEEDDEDEDGDERRGGSHKRRRLT